MLKLENVDVSYGKVHVLHEVSLEANSGSVVALLGANGAGKSTTLKAISGIVRPSRGSIVFDGEDLAGADPSAIVRRGIIHCPEGRQVFAGFTVSENLRMGAYGRGSADAFESVLELFPILRERLTQHAGTLSGGEQQMLAIGRALMASPRLLMLDEPSLGLAPVIVEQIFEIIENIVDRGVTVLLVEQNAALALEVADYAYALAHGRVRYAGPAAELHQSDVLAAAYLGEALA